MGQLSPFATATEACMLYRLSSTAREATAMRSPHTETKNSPHLLQHLLGTLVLDPEPCTLPALYQTPVGNPEQTPHSSTRGPLL